MLKQLFIKDFTLIDELNISFNPGFSVITGETGAGKSIILGAIGLLLGQRADTKSIRQDATRCVIEAHFDLSPYPHLESFFFDHDLDSDLIDTLIRRELTSTGKSRAFINDTPVALATLRELGEQIVDIHSQHQNLLLGREDFQLSVVDLIADDASLLKQYRSAFANWKQVREKLAESSRAALEAQENQDYVRYQLNELEQAHLQAGEQELLEEERERMCHAEDIKGAFYDTTQTFASEGGTLDMLRQATNRIHKIEPYLADAVEITRRLDESYIELKDLTEEMATQAEATDFDPQRMNQVTDRLDLLYSLQSKFHKESVEELMDLRDELTRELALTDEADARIAQLKQEEEEQHQACKQLATRLTSVRKNAAKKVELEMQKRLIPLGIVNVRFQVEMTPRELRADGGDDVCFLFSANKNAALQPISTVASGGEIARVMLALKALMSGSISLPTIIFDEIDTGVSGKIAEQMAIMMREMGVGPRQVISITHLPQIAAMGTTHYRVYKEDESHETKSHMRELSETERVREIAQMLSGSEITDAAMHHAHELLSMKQKS